MIVKLFAVVDRVSGIFDGPHKAVNEAQFLRGVSDLVNRKDTELSNHPEDFYVVELGTYNDSTGDIIPLDAGPTRIADATDFIQEVN